MRGIQFDSESIRALREGRKSQSRRPLNRPYGHAGTRLYVRETYREFDDGDVFYAADFELGVVPVHADDDPADWRWQSSRFMPERLARMVLTLTADPVPEPVQDITADDAWAEGAPTWESQPPYMWFARRWDSIWGKRCPWASQPWVWKLVFSVEVSGT